MPTSEFEKKIHRWASLICCFGELQMPGQGWKYLQLAGIRYADTYRGELRTWKHLQFAGIGFADAWSGLEVSAICWYWICRCLSWGRKYLQLAGFGFVDAWSGLEASATSWNWICRCLVRVGSICNLLVLDL